MATQIQKIGSFLLLCSATALASPISTHTYPKSSIGRDITKGMSGGLNQLPIVDLGYERHQATRLEPKTNLYVFSDIRYAEPPVGDLRFAAPIPPKGRSSPIKNGTGAPFCYQALPLWAGVTEYFQSSVGSGQPFNQTLVEEQLAIGGPGNLIQEPNMTEDCLFLDLYVPQAIFQKATTSKDRGERDFEAEDGDGSGGVPVLIWIHGGGFATGSKTSMGLYNPTTLIETSKIRGSDGIIFVAINYRLGAFGWLSGPTFQAQGGLSNAGLYDQRLAFQWVQDHIHKFGGDPSKVTVMGESAGGASIIHHLTAYGGLAGSPPFAKAIPQSAAFMPQPGNLQQEQTYDTFLNRLNVSTIKQARKLPSKALAAANMDQMFKAQYGTFVFGPAVDGLIVPALPEQLLKNGQFASEVSLMVGHNSDESFLFVNPSIQSSEGIEAYLRSVLPDVSNGILKRILSEFYPPVFDGTYPYKTQFERYKLLVAEFRFTCNTNYLNRAYGSQSYAYQFSASHGRHAEDLYYTFANGPNPKVANNSLATAMQEYITSFVQTGVPEAPGFPDFQVYEAAGGILNLNTSKIGIIPDETANERCAFWQKGLFF